MGCRAEGAAPPPAMRTQQVRKHKSRWILIIFKIRCARIKIGTNLGLGWPSRSHLSCGTVAAYVDIYIYICIFVPAYIYIYIYDILVHTQTHTHIYILAECKYMIDIYIGAYVYIYIYNMHVLLHMIFDPYSHILQ